MNPPIPDYAEPFEGWRVWQVSSNGRDPRLRSVLQKTLWPPREELAAECLRRRILARVRGGRRHEAPDKACACGIYATSLEHLGSYLRGCGDHRTRFAFGRVHLWGTVIECEQGWRASRAYPAEIMVPTAPQAGPAGIMASPQPEFARARAEDIADALSCYAVPVVVLPRTPAEALDLVAHERGRDGHIGSFR
jgi:hypothetical protein